MAKRSTIDTLASDVAKILSEYAEDADKTTREAVQKVAKSGVQALKGNPGGFGGSGRYSKGWRSKIETNRFGSMATIYNGSQPGLPHLLEHGHAKRGGGRTSGVAHIEPVEQQIIKGLEKAIEVKI